MTELTNENYYSKQTGMEYMSYSQFKDFMECEAMAIAIIEGRYEKKATQALKVGAFFDSHFSGEEEAFKANNPDMFLTRGENKGEPKAEFKAAQNAIDAVDNDPAYKEMFFSGNAQEIVTGVIEGVPFKGKIDCLYPDERIVDWKLMADVDDKWDDELRKKVPFYQIYGYHIQQAIYQELYRQKTGKRLPCFLVALTKTNPVEKHAYQFSQEVLDKALGLVRMFAPRYQKIKNHELEPVECGKCGYYHENHKFDIFDIVEVTEII